MTPTQMNENAFETLLVESLINEGRKRGQAGRGRNKGHAGNRRVVSSGKPGSGNTGYRGR